MARRLLPYLGAVVLAALALVLAHQLVFLVRYGSIYGEALAHEGHGPAWSDAVATVIGGSIVLFAGSVLGLWRMTLQLRGRQREARQPRSDGAAAADVLGIARGWLRASVCLTVVVLVLLTAQENIEHASAGLGLPGPGILISPEYPFAVAIVAAVSFIVSLVATLLTWRRAVLLARLRALRAQDRRMPRPAIRIAIPWVERRHAAIVGHHITGRAPPGVIAA